MQAKALEIRDEGTFIPALAVNMHPANGGQRYLMRRVGYPCDRRPNVILTRLSGDGRATNDPYAWDTGARTWPVAHKWIIEHWNELRDGDVVDVSFILGETNVAKGLGAHLAAVARRGARAVTEITVLRLLTFMVLLAFMGAVIITVVIKLLEYAQ